MRRKRIWSQLVVNQTYQTWFEKTKVNLSSNRNFCSKTQPIILFKLDEWCNIGHLGFWVATHLLIHPDLTDGGGDVVDAGHGGVLQGHVVLQGAVVHAH